MHGAFIKIIDYEAYLICVLVYYALFNLYNFLYNFRENLEMFDGILVSRWTPYVGMTQTPL